MSEETRELDKHTTKTTSKYFWCTAFALTEQIEEIPPAQRPDDEGGDDGSRAARHVHGRGQHAPKCAELSRRKPLKTNTPDAKSQGSRLHQ